MINRTIKIMITNRIATTAINHVAVLDSLLLLFSLAMPIDETVNK